MGYETEFRGQFTITPTLQPAHLAYLKAFHCSRRMNRDPAKTAAMPDPVREAAGLPLGEAAEYFVGAAGADYGKSRTADVIDYNAPPASQPGLWCGWEPGDDGESLHPEDGKNYAYREWLAYLLARFLKPWGYTVTGEVRWRGEDFDDVGTMVEV